MTAARLRDLRRTAGFLGGLVAGLALIVFALVLDVGLVVRAYERSATSTLVAVLGAALAALVTVLAVVRYRERRALRWVAIAWAVLFVVAVLWTHPRRRDDLLGPIEAGVVSYVVIVVAAALIGFPLAVRRRG